jgi:hypothetical protein
MGRPALTRIEPQVQRANLRHGMNRFSTNICDGRSVTVKAHPVLGHDARGFLPVCGVAAIGPAGEDWVTGAIMALSPGAHVRRQ